MDSAGTLPGTKQTIESPKVQVKEFRFDEKLLVR